MLHIPRGAHALDSPLLLDADILASEVLLVGVAGAELRPPPGDSTLIVLVAGAPPVRMRGLSLSGQLRASGSSLAIHDCSFAGGNTRGRLSAASGSSALLGGALLVDGDATIQVQDSRFINLHADLGGAIALLDGSLSLHNSTLDSNRATQCGGAVFASGGVLVVLGCSFAGNEAATSGGALAINGTAAVLLANGTRLTSNGAPVGRTLAFIAGSLAYGLPAPIGTWVASGGVCEQGSSDLAPPCDFERVEAIRGLTVSTIAPGTNEDEDFPFDCPPGVVGGSLEVVHQTRPSCSYPCPERYFCPRGTVQPAHCTRGGYCERGVSSPQACPATMTSEVGSGSLADCVCGGGFFHDNGIADEGEAPCTSCPSGFDCRARIGLTISSLPVKRGYYRLHALSLDVRRCPDAATNCDDAPECPESTSGCRGTVDAPVDDHGSTSSLLPRRLESNGFEAGCNGGLTRVFCLLCAPSDSRVYYSSATSSELAQCRECGDLARDTILTALGIAAGTGALLLLLARWYRRYVPIHHKEQLLAAWRAFKPHVKLKVLIGFYMIATKVSEVYEVELPHEVRRLISVFSIGISFGFNGVDTVLECLGMRGYVATLALYMIAPPVLALLILLIALARMPSKSRHSGAELLETAVPPLLMLFFLAYPLITNIAFDAFPCHEFNESEWLKADVAIQCGTPEHDDAKALAWVAICLYPIGLLVLNASLLYTARRAIQSTSCGVERTTPLSRAISFLHREFEPHLFWWEVRNGCPQRTGTSERLTADD